MTKFYTSDNFARSNEEAVQFFLHHSLDHMKAACFLKDHPSLLDSASYLTHLAFEILFKAILLHKFKKLSKDKDLKKIIKQIVNNPNTKGGRILMLKKREAE